MRGSLLLLAALSVLAVQGDVSRDKRSDDSQALEGVVSGLSQQLTEVKAQLTTLQNSLTQQQQQIQQQHDKLSFQTAVHAVLHRDLHAGKDQTIKFDQVQFNHGSAYNPATGVFTAPVNGVYVFIFSARSTDIIHSSGVYLKVAGHAQVYVDSKNSLATGHGTFHLNAGNQAWVASSGSNHNLNSGDSMFTAFLLSPDL